MSRYSRYLCCTSVWRRGLPAHSTDECAARLLSPPRAAELQAAVKTQGETVKALKARRIG